MRLNITNKCENYELFYPFGFNTLNIEALLTPGQCQVIIGIRQKYYQLYNFNLVLLSHQTPKEVPIFSIIQNNLFSGRKNNNNNNNINKNNKFKFVRQIS